MGYTAIKQKHLYIVLIFLVVETLLYICISVAFSTLSHDPPWTGKMILNDVVFFIYLVDITVIFSIFFHPLKLSLSAQYAGIMWEHIEVIKSFKLS